MTKYNKEELFLIIQMLSGLFLATALSFVFTNFFGGDKGLYFFLIIVGLSIIIWFWKGLNEKYNLFLVGMILSSFTFGIYFILNF